MGKKITTALLALYIMSLLAIPVLAQDNTGNTDTSNDGKSESVLKEQADRIQRNVRTSEQIRDAQREHETRIVKRFDKDGTANRVVRAPAEGDFRKVSVAKTKLQRELEETGTSLRSKRLSEEDKRKIAAKREAAKKLAEERKIEIKGKRSGELELVRRQREERLAKKQAIGIGKRKVEIRKLQESRDKYSDSKTKYNDIRKRQEKKKQSFDDAREDLRECQNTGQDCSKLRDEATAEAKQHLLDSIDRMIAKLEKLITRAEASESLTEEQIKETVAGIGVVIDKLKRIKAKAEAATTKQQMKEAAKDARDAWNAAERRIKKYSYRMIGRRLGLTIQRAEKLEGKLNCALDNLGDKVTPDIEGAVEEFDTYVSAARTEFEKAREIWRDTTDRDMNEAKLAISSGHESLRDAHDTLKRVLSMIREAGGSFAGCEI